LAGWFSQQLAHFAGSSSFSCKIIDVVVISSIFHVLRVLAAVVAFVLHTFDSGGIWEDQVVSLGIQILQLSLIYW